MGVSCESIFFAFQIGSSSEHPVFTSLRNWNTPQLNERRHPNFRDISQK